MCPGCMVAAAVAAAEDTSASGLLALAVRAFRAWTGAKAIEPQPLTAGEQDGAPQNRVAR